MTCSTGMDKIWEPGFSNTGFNIKLLLEPRSGKGPTFVKFVVLVAKICGERFGEDDATRSEEKTSSLLDVLGSFFGGTRGQPENVDDFLVPEK